MPIKESDISGFHSFRRLDKVKCSCDHCGGEFERDKRHVVKFKDFDKDNLGTTKCYCSAACKAAANGSQTIFCRCCGKRTPEGRAFCSPECKEKTRKTRTLSEETKKKIAATLVRFNESLPKRVPLLKKMECVNCGKTFEHIHKIKTCSEVCYKEHHSKRQSEALKNPERRKNLQRNRRSYMETSFSDFLDKHGIQRDEEFHIRNHELNKSYYADFYFKQFNLIIELDGTQHRYRQESDTVRDEYIQRVLGIKVVRISHYEYIKKLRMDEICELLGIKMEPRAGVAPAV